MTHQLAQRTVTRRHSLAEVRTRPPDLDDDAVTRSLAVGWGVQAASMFYVPEGGGSHHWKVTDASGGVIFVRADDLDDKDWLGDTKGMFCSKTLAEASRHRRGAAHRGRAVLRRRTAACHGRYPRSPPFTPRYAISVYPYLAGGSYPFGPYTDQGVRSVAMEMVTAVTAHSDRRALGPAARTEDRPPRPPRRVPPRARPTLEWRAIWRPSSRPPLAPHAATLAEVVRAYDELVRGHFRCKVGDCRHPWRAPPGQRHVGVRHPYVHRLGHRRPRSAGA